MRSLTLKLSLAFLAVSLVATLLVVAFAVWTTVRRFNRFVTDQNRVTAVDQLADYHRANDSWEGVAESFPFLNQPRFFVPGDAPSEDLPTGGGRFLTLMDNQRRVVIAGAGYQIGDQVAQEQYNEGVLVELDGTEVGRLFFSSDARRLAGPEARFLSQVNQAFVFGAVGAAIVAVLLGLLLARSLTRPLRELTEATRAVAEGDLSRKVPVRSRDELGELADSFNQMNDQLVNARDLRQQMTADIAHDLRTPLSVIVGHSEALSDGLLPPSKETFDIILDEAQRLSRLVDDLRTLSLAEAGELQLARRPVAPRDLLLRSQKSHDQQARQKNISLELAAGPDLPAVDVDPDRMAQVLDNLLNNALRFTPEGGWVRLTARQDDPHVQLMVQDSGSGIPAEELSHIFTRFYKGDKSRQRHDEEGSGLGLAIAKSIVEAHGGSITAESQSGQGVTFILSLRTSATG